MRKQKKLLAVILSIIMIFHLRHAETTQMTERQSSMLRQAADTIR